MTRDESISPASASRRPRSVRAARIVAGGFIGAFGASILTVIYTGLHVGAPRGPKMGNTVATTPAKRQPHAAPVDATVDQNGGTTDRDHEGQRDESDPPKGADGRAEPAR
jgi:hypothetical protein